MTKESEVLVNFYMNEDKKTELMVILARERKSMKDFFNDYVEEYIKVHGDGNNQYKITQFEDENMSACPALFRPLDTWKWWLNNAPEKEVIRVRDQIVSIDKILVTII